MCAELSLFSADGAEAVIIRGVANRKLIFISLLSAYHILSKLHTNVWEGLCCLNSYLIYRKCSLLFLQFIIYLLTFIAKSFWDHRSLLQRAESLVFGLMLYEGIFYFNSYLFCTLLYVVHTQTCIHLQTLLGDFENFTFFAKIAQNIRFEQKLMCLTIFTFKIIWCFTKPPQSNDHVTSHPTFIWQKSGWRCRAGAAMKH